MRLKLLFVSLFTLCLFNAYAGIETVSSRVPSGPLSAALSVGTIINVQDVKMTPNFNRSFADRQVENMIRIGVDQYSTHLTAAFERYYLLEIITKDTFLYETKQTIRLYVKYNPYNITYNDADQMIYRFQGTHDLSVRILAIEDASGTPVSSPANVFLEASVSSDRVYAFDHTLSVPSIIGTAIDINGDGINDELEISWGPGSGAEEYELEWTYANDYDFDINGSLITKTPDYDFKNNSTRIVTTATAYKINLVYERGYVVYRVRPVGADTTLASGMSAKLFGAWSEPDAGSVASLPSGSKYYQSVQHQRNLNWQYSAVFAEEGKKKENITYADGSLRSRQVVTKNNTDDHAIVAETMYDYQGRAAVQVLPAPVDSALMHYYQKFNRDTEGSAYDKAVFDKDKEEIPCELLDMPMGNAYGAAKYYSSSNPYLSSLQPGKEYEAFLPDAKGYPFVRTEYMPDNTGRIRRQGGPGPDLRLGMNRETRYLYGQPVQEQLDRMFGSEAGYASRYKKNAVIDPNGQISVSYLDDEGRVVATALSGDQSLNLTNLPSYGSSNRSINANLFGYDAQSRKETNAVNLDSTGIEFTYPLLVTTAGNYTFSYTIEDIPSYNLCLEESICFDCIYDLELKIINDCGVNMLTGIPAIKLVGNVTPQDTNLSCSAALSFTDYDDLTVSMPVGSYMISKKLTINRRIMDYYYGKYLDTLNNTCLKKLSYFVDSALATIDYSGCDIELSCSSCDTLFGERPGTDSLARIWDMLVAECRKQCEPGTTCEAGYRMMLSDMSPGGQYAQFSKDPLTQKVVTGAFPLSVLNHDNYLPKRFSNYTGNDTLRAAYWRNPVFELGGYEHRGYCSEDMQRTLIPVFVYQTETGEEYYPEILPNSLRINQATGDPYVFPEDLKYLDDFLRYWRDSWAKSLVRYHPEYDYYALCAQNAEQSYSDYGYFQTSDELDFEMYNTATYSDALTKEILLSSANEMANHMMKLDPYFGGVGEPQKERMRALIENYHGGISMAQLAALTTRCPGFFGNDIPSGCSDFGDDGLGEDIRNAEWEKFRGFYLAEKQKLQQEYYDKETYSGRSKGYNACIGSDTYNVLSPVAGVFPLFSVVSFVSDVFQPCARTTYSLYKNKIKRFRNGSKDVILLSHDIEGDPDGALEELKNRADFTHYQQTGQCPLTRDLEFFLSELLAKDELQGTNISTMRFNGFSQVLYDSIKTPHVYEKYTDFTWSGLASGSWLTGSLDSVGVNRKQVKLFLPGGRTWSNTDIAKFGRLQSLGGAPGAYNFRIPAIDRSGLDTFIIIGETDLNISNCSFPDQCDPGPLALQLVNLMSGIASEASIISGVNLVNNLLNDSYPALVATIGNNAPSGWQWTYHAAASFPIPAQSFVLENNATDQKIVCQMDAIGNIDDIREIRSVRRVKNAPANRIEFTGYTGGAAERSVFKASVYYLDNTRVALDSALVMGKCHLPYAFDSTATVNFCGEGIDFQVLRDLTKLMADSVFTKQYSGETGELTGVLVKSTHLVSSNVLITPHIEKYLYDQIEITSAYNTQDSVILGVNGTGLVGEGVYEDLGTISCQIRFAKAEPHPANLSDYNMMGIGNAYPIYSDTGYRTAAKVYLVAKTSPFTPKFITVSMFMDNTCGIPFDICDACETAPNLVRNGDFEQGGYLVNSNAAYHANVTDLSTHSGQNPKFTIVKNISQLLHSSWNDFDLGRDFDDHTDPGHGHYMIRTTSGSYPNSQSILTKVWTDTVRVQRHTPYTFSLWTLNPHNYGQLNTYTPFQYADALYMKVNNTAGNQFYVNNTEFAPYGVWVQHKMDWYSDEDTIAVLTVWEYDNADHFNYGIDDIDFRKGACSPPDTLGFAYVSPVDTLDSLNCAAYLKNIAIANARHDYDVYLNGLKNNFVRNYTSKCLSASEDLTMSFADREYHHTLYYYDQAGNLVRTVPPEGVRLITDTDSLSMIASDRLLNRRTIYTDHTYTTTYQYNSLNQLVAQTMPDHRQMEKFNISLSEGLPENILVTGVEFTDTYNGYLTGNVSGVGYVFNTSDGGLTWHQQSSIGSSELRGVSMTSTSVGFAVGSGGALLKTTDAGLTWNPIPLGSTASFTAISFANSQIGCIGGKDGLILYTTDGGNNWYNGGTGISGDITSIDLKAGAAGYATTVINGQGHLFRTLNGGKSWIEKKQVIANNLSAIQFFNANEGYIAGESGTLLYTANSGVTYNLVPNGFTSDIKNVHFKDKNTGCVLLANGEIWTTTTQGAGWSKSNATGVGESLNGFTFYDLSVGYAVGNNGLVVRTSNGGISWQKITNSPSIAQNLYSAYIIDPSSVMIAGAGGKIFSATGVSASTTISWTTITPNSSGDVYVKLHFRTVEDGLVLAADGSAYTAYRSGGVWNWNSVSGADSVISFVFAAVDTGYMLGRDNMVSKTTDGGYNWVTPPGQAYTGAGLKAIALNKLNRTNQLIVAGNAGKIYASPDAGQTWTDRSRTIVPLPLNVVEVVDNNTIYAAGSRGTFLKTTDGGTTWHLIRLPDNKERYALNFKNANNGVLGGEEGIVHTTSNGGASWTARTSGTGHAFRAMVNSGDTLWAVSARADLMVSLNYGITWSITGVIETGGMHAIASSSSSQVVAVGSNGKIVRTLNGGFAWADVTVNANQEELYTTFMVNAQLGYAGGDAGLLMRTTDGGMHWTTINTGLNAIKKLFFTSPEKGYAIVASTGIMTTADSGATWSAMSHPDYELNDIYFTAGRGCAVGNDGAMLVFDGTAWSDVTGTTSEHLYTVHFIEESGYAAGNNGVILHSDDYGINWISQSNPATGVALYDVYFIDKRTGYVVGDKGHILKTTDGGAVWTRKEYDADPDLRNLAFIGDHTAVITGNTHFTLQMKDLSDRYSLRFWYDRLGRLIISQNSKQEAMDPPAYSYTLYDALGRITEVGELLSVEDPDTYYVNGSISDQRFSQWLASASARREITRTWYDQAAFQPAQPGFRQLNLRGRVASTTYQDADGAAYDYATHYSYDIHGNVSTILQDNPPMNTVQQQYKLISYVYDLISGNVKEVRYQSEQPDQFFHRYEYDADNRLVQVLSSSDGLVWEKDAKYFYYRHGPLARTELGEMKVQGIDYAYTLQGWLKGVNSNTLRSNRDMGLDSESGNPNEVFAADEFGYSLNYFKGTGGDYTPVASAAFLASTTGSSFETDSKDLFNGNIKSMITAVRGLGDATAGGQGMVYTYDRLNRVSQAVAYQNMNVNTNAWANTGSSDNYKENYTYDANGNILTLKRRNGDQNLMDDLAYVYETKANGYDHNTNRLRQVTDAAGKLNDSDLDTQAPDNYDYDQAGNLLKDVSEGITEIEWNVYGKIREIHSTSRPDVAYRYDAAGNRIAKIIKPTSTPSTWEITTYVRDASGNIMAIYEHKNSAVKLKEQNVYGSSRLGTYKPGLQVFPVTNGNSLDFDGTDDYVNISAASATGTGGGYFSVEAWIKLDTLGLGDPVDGTGIMRNTNYAGNTGDWMLSVTPSGSLCFFNWQVTGTDPGGRLETDTPLIRANQWHHVAAVWDNTSNYLYVDGILRNTSSGSTGTGWGTAHEIGRLSSGTHFAGKIAEVREWNVARSSHEIAQYKDRNLTGSETGLVAYYPLNETSGQIVHDRSGSANGTLGSSSSVQSSDPVWSSGDSYLPSVVHYTGNKVYELSNHLGNVLTTVSDRRYRPSGLSIASVALARTAQDYYPFGMLMPGRTNNTEESRFGGAGGQEKDDEIYGAGNAYTAANWEYDPRLGRRWNVDPIIKPWESSYATFSNNPILLVDPDGLDPEKPISNPQHGDKHGNLTYDGETKSWMLPEATITANKEPSAGAQVVKGAAAPAAKFALDGMKRTNYYNPMVSEFKDLLKAGKISDGTYSMLRYQAQKATKMQLSTMGQAVSEVPPFGKPLSQQKALAEAVASGQPLPQGAGATRGSTTRLATAAQVGGKVLVVAGVAMSVHHVVTADDKGLAISQEAGGYAGAWAGAEGGAAVGAAVGVWFGGVGAAPGAVIGGFVGGVAGYFGGYEVGGAAYKSATD